eukprot:gene1286-1457_t
MSTQLLLQCLAMLKAVLSNVIATSVNSNAYLAADGSQDTFWQSSVCFPTGYITYPAINQLLGICSTVGSCQSSVTQSPAPDLSAATDGNTNSLVNIYTTAQPGHYWFQIGLPTPAQLRAVTVKAVSPATGLHVLGVTSSGSLVDFGLYSSAYTVQNYLVNSNSVFAAVRLQANASFGVFELSARTTPCFEYVTVDYGSLQTITALTIRHYADNLNVVNTSYSVSADGVTWTVLRQGPYQVPPNLVSPLDVDLNPPVSARYVRVTHFLPEGASNSVMIWEVSAWGVGGKYGPLGRVQPNPITFAQLLGVNAIWGWGGLKFTSSYNSTSNLGPYRFNKMASHARNYHNWNWDVTSPALVPNFQQMVAPGSVDYGVLPGHSSQLAQDWLNWDNEYSAWR